MENPDDLAGKARRYSYRDLLTPGLFLAIVAVLPYLRTLGYGFVNLDDPEYLFAHPQIQQGLSYPNITWAFTYVGDAIWMPATWLSYMLDVTLWGLAPGILRAINIVLHSANTVLLFLLLLRLQNGKQERRLLLPCVVGALIWAVHPLRVEPVVWIASRKDMLFLFWELLALLAWLRRLDPRRSQWHAAVWWGIAMGCWILSGLSKPTAMTFPVLAGLLEYLKTGNVRWRDYSVPVILAGILGSVAAYAQDAGGATIALAHVPWTGRIVNACAAFGLYVWKTICPTELAVQYQHRWPEMPRFWLQGLFICGLYGGGLLICCHNLFGSILRKRVALLLSSNSTGNAQMVPSATGIRLLFVSLTFFLLSISPMLGLSPFGAHSHADRFTYLPSIGFSLLAAGFLGDCSSKRIRALLFLAVIICPVLMFLTHHQARYWKNDVTLFNRTLMIDGKDNVLANIHLGMYYYEFGHEVKTASQYFKHALRCDEKKSGQIYPLYIICLCEMGHLHEARMAASRLLDWAAERVQEQRVRMGMAMDVSPRRAVASYVAYAAISIEEDDFELAREHLDMVLSVQPESVFAQYLLGRLALRQGDKPQALYHWRQALNYRSEPYIWHRFLWEEISKLEKPGNNG